MTDEECRAKLVKILDDYENNPGLKASKTYYLDEFIALASKSREGAKKTEAIGELHKVIAELMQADATRRACLRQLCALIV